MITGGMEREYEYLIELLACALHGKHAENRLDQVDAEKLFRAALFHGVEAMAFDAVRPWLDPNAELTGKWKEAFRTNAIVELCQMAEYEEIVRQFTGAGVTIVPLKGILMKQMYPRPVFRKMGDLDILIEEGKQEICRDLMEGMGYEVLEYGQYHHDVYAKGCVRVELHNALFHEKEIGWQQPYFENIMDRTFLSITNRKVRFLTDEAFYVYNLTHFAKHYYNKGSGLRSMMDIYVNSREKNKMYMENVRRILRDLYLEGLLDVMLCLSQKCFSLREFNLDLEEKEVLEKVVVSGVRGVPELGLRQLIQRFADESKSMPDSAEYIRDSKRKYFFSLVFLDLEQMKGGYPILKRFEWMLPFCWIYRMVRVLFLKREKLKQDWELLMK